MVRRRTLLAAPALLLAPSRAWPAWLPPGAQLTFDEDFSAFSAAPDGRARWTTTLGYGGPRALSNHGQPRNGEQQAYVTRGMIGASGTDPIEIDPFIPLPRGLAIQAAPTPAALLPRLWGQGYTSGLLSTRFTHNQLYGHVEIEARPPEGAGLRMVVWLLRRDRRWPPDIMLASLGGRPEDRLWTGLTTRSEFDQAVTLGRFTDRPARGFHRFGLSWDVERIAWFLNGDLLAEMPTPPDLHMPMHLLIGLPVGDRWSGTPDATTRFPARFELSRIRMWSDSAARPGGRPAPATARAGAGHSLHAGSTETSR